MTKTKIFFLFFCLPLFTKAQVVLEIEDRVKFDYQEYFREENREINRATPPTLSCDAHRTHNIHFDTGKKRFDYYGSGDVNNDGIIDKLDIFSIDTAQTYRADVGGDGIVNTNDKAILEDFLNNKIEYLPGDWNKLKTKEERISWIEKILPIELKLRKNQVYTQNDSLDYTSEQSFVNFNGISNIGEYLPHNCSEGYCFLLDTTANGIYNLPVYILYQSIADDGFFVIVEPKALQILVGDDPLRIDDWYKWDFQNNIRVEIGGEEIDGNERAFLGMYVYSRNIWDGSSDFSWDHFITWELQNEEQKEIHLGTEYVLRNSPKISYVNLKTPSDMVLDYIGNIDILKENTGIVQIINAPTVGKDFYYSHESVFGDGINVISGDIYIRIASSLVDTIYFGVDKKNFKVKKKTLVELIERNVLSSPVTRMIFYFNGGVFTCEHVLAKDSVYQNLEVRYKGEYCDLQLTDIELSPMNISSSEPNLIYLKYRLENHGPANMSNAKINVEYFIRKDNLPFSLGDSINIGRVVHEITLANGSYADIVLDSAQLSQIRIPKDADGGYYIFVKVDHDLSSKLFDPLEANNYTGLWLVVGVNDFYGQVPNDFKLYQNYPNPFNPTTTIKYQLPEQPHVSLKVYDLLGKEIATLVNEEKQPGTYEVKFDGTGLSSGVYFYRLHTGSFSDTKKFVFIK